jgi:hypothetical protein
MKTVKFSVNNLGIILIGIILVLGSVISCKKFDYQTNNDPYNYKIKMLNEDIGHKHNLYLSRLLSDNALSEISDFGLTGLIRVLDSCVEYAIMDGYDIDSVINIRNEIVEMFTNDLVVEDDITYVLDSGNLIKEYLVSVLNFSEAFGTEVTDLHHLAKYSTNNLMEAIHDDFGNYYFNPYENEIRDLFVCIADSSNVFWQTYFEERPETEWGRTEWVYFNDALGGVLGSVFGGIGSVLMGASLSYVTEKQFDKLED